MIHGLYEKMKIVLELGIDKAQTSLQGTVQKVLLDSLWVELPSQEHQTLVEKATALTLRIFDPGGVFFAKSKLVRLEEDCLVVVTRPKEFEVLQRRAFFRLAVQVPLRLLAEPQNVTLEAPATDDMVSLDVKTLDLSGGGVGFLCPVPLNLESLIKLTLWLPDQSPFRCRARVARCHHLADKDQYHVGVEFHNIHPKRQDQIVAYLNEILRKKRL